MTSSNGWGIKSALVGIAAVVLLGGERAKADFAFGAPTLVPNVNHTGYDYAPNVSPDGLELYFSSERSGGSGDGDLWVSRRATTADEWGTPENLGATLNSYAYEGSPNISSDGLELYFDSHRPGGSGGDDLWVSRRVTTEDDWGIPENLGPAVNSSVEDYSASISSDGLELYFSSDRDGYGIWVTRRATTNKPWGASVRLASTVNCVHPNISTNRLVLLFCGWLPGGYGDTDTWIMRRATRESDWETAANLGPMVNSPYSEREPMLSHDSRTLYFTSNRPDGLGDLDIWQAPVIPLVDFNGDGNVNGFEVGKMAENWGTDESSCDIGPTPWGDGTIDVHDLAILAEYIGKDVIDTTCIAHWALDETAGEVAADSAGDHHGTVTGTCLWHSDTGRIDGALELDGASFVVTDHILSPAGGAFSVLAWVQGGAPGQVIISQDTGSEWLAIDPESGGLMTAIAPPEARHPTGPLVSDATVTDGLWHRVALVWDGASRNLYVDETLVAADAQGGLVPCTGGLNIGCGSDQSVGSFFTGLIDDVRIYNRAVRP